MLMKVFKRLGWYISDEPSTASIGEIEEGRMISRYNYELRDWDGRAYTMVVAAEDPLSERMWVIPVGKRRRGQIAFTGYIEVLRDNNTPPDTATLADIRIHDPNNRHKGLGTAMLHQVFEILRGQGICHAHGFVTAEDQAATPGLLDWYRREGFTVRQGARAALIRIDLHDVQFADDRDNAESQEDEFGNGK